MKHLFPRVIALMLALMLIFPAAVLADELPHAFWAIDDAYSAAVNNGDYYGTVEYGTQAINLLSTYPETEQITNIMASRLDKIGLAYEHLGKYEEAADTYTKYIPYAKKLNWADGVKIAEAKVKHYTPDLRLYTETNETQKYFGAKNEPERGILYGSAYTELGEATSNDESMALVYIEFGDNSILNWLNAALNDAEQDGIAVEVAWNFPGEGGDLGSLQYNSEHIDRVLSLLASHPNVPIYLRIGAEMNVWTVAADPGEFISTFIYLATAARSKCPNAAIVWSVGHASSWDKNIDDYYPGDEYVDWVGISLYANKYFLGKVWPDDQKYNEVVFCAGDGADPVKMAEEVITKYGGRKPVMISECGASHTIRTLGEDATSWAQTKLRQIYSYLPMVYPQIKLIAYFDVVMPSETSDYSLTSSPELRNTYNSLTSSLPTLIRGKYTGPPNNIYKELFDGFYTSGSNLNVSAYAHIYGVDEPAVNYFIDGTWVGGSGTLPYTQNLDISGLAGGTHTLTVVSGDTSRDYTFTKDDNGSSITLKINGNVISTDVPPVIENDRTLVPIRVISENLGAEVDWDDNTQTVKIKKGNKDFRLTIGDTKIRDAQGNTITEIDVPAKIVNGRTMVPVRAVSEILGAAVDWSDSTQTVLITT